MILLDPGWNFLETSFLDRLINLIVHSTSTTQEYASPRPITSPFSVADHSLLSQIVYQMSTQPTPESYPHQLYGRLQIYLNRFFGTILRDYVAAGEGEDRLRRLTLAWKQTEAISRDICLVFGYLDQSISPPEDDATHTQITIKKLIITGFKVSIVDTFSDSIIQTTLDLFRKSRDMLPCDLTLVYNTIQTLIVTDPNPNHLIYLRRFIQPLQADTVAYFMKKSEELLKDSNNDVVQYTKQAETLLLQDYERTRATLLIDSSRQIESFAHAALLRQSQEQILGITLQDKVSTPIRPGSFQLLLQNFSNPENITHIARIYNLYKSAPPSLVLLAHAFRNHIIRQASSALQSINDLPLPQQGTPGASGALPPPQVVLQMRLSHVIPRLAQVYDAAQGVLISCFQSDSIFSKELRSAFEQILGLRLQHVFSVQKLIMPHTLPQGHAQQAALVIPHITELLANQCDVLLRQPTATAGAAAAATTATTTTTTTTPGGSTIAISVPEQVLSACDTLVKLFEVISDKDEFLDFYRKLLAKRLLLQRSLSLDYEVVFVRRLQNIWGQQSVANLLVMLTDISNSIETSKLYTESQYNPLNNTAVNIRTLSLGSWPQYDVDEKVHIASKLQEHVEGFEKFYFAATDSRKLSWLHTLGTVVLKASFLPGSPEIVCSTIQASILLQFQKDVREYKMSDLLQIMGLDEIKFQLQARPLYTGMAPLLLKEPSTGFSKNDIIKLNDGIKIPPNVKRLRIAPALTKLPALVMKPAGVGIGTVPTTSSTTSSTATSSAAGGIRQQGGATSDILSLGPTGSGTGMDVSSQSHQLHPGTGIGSVDHGSLGPTQGGMSDFTDFTADKEELSEVEKNHCADSHIIRVMKKNKRLSHDKLIEAATESINGKFAVQVAFLKKRIEELIHREYLERDPQDPTYYIYD